MTSSVTTLHVCTINISLERFSYHCAEIWLVCWLTYFRRSLSILHHSRDHREGDNVAGDADVAQRLEAIVGHQITANGGRHGSANSTVDIGVVVYISLGLSKRLLLGVSHQVPDLGWFAAPLSAYFCLD